MATPRDDDAVVERLDRLEALVRDLAERVAAPPPAALSVAETCARWRVSRATFDRWLADPTSGLDGLVVRPNGPGGRVLVPAEAFAEWMRSRAAGPAVARRRRA